MYRHRRVIALAVFCPLIALTTTCGDDSRTPAQPGDGVGGTPAPAPQVARLAWSQAAPSAAVVQGYGFILFVDGTRTTFTGATCAASPTPAGFECFGPLPALSPGRRVLEISTLDQGRGLESPRSGSLAIDVGTDGRPRPLVNEGEGPILVPSTTCATETPTECFIVTVIARDVAPVRRLLALPDGRLLMLTTGGAVTILPSSTSERPEFSATSAGMAVDVLDVAVDPDFGATRFVYLAITATAPDGRRTVSVVRMRELADRLGEPATIVADLPASPGGDPAMSIGPDRCIYLAMPGPAAGRAGYSGYVLRFTPDGRAAGNDRNGSPIFAEGPARPTRLAWDAAGRLLMASAEPGPRPVLAVVPIEPGFDQWPAPWTALTGTLIRSATAAVSDVAAAPILEGSSVVAMLARTADGPAVLRLATVSGANRPESALPRTIPLGPLTPSAVAFAGNGDPIIAAIRGPEPGAFLVRLQRIPPHRAP